MSDTHQIIVVCTGNTCRSPMGARLLAHALAAEEGRLKDVTVTSAGIAAYDGDAPSHHSIKVLKKVGLDLSRHRSRRLTHEMVDGALAIVVMTEAHRNAIRSAFPDLKTPIVLYREHMGDHADPQVPDPYGNNLDAYEDTRDALAEAVPSLVAFLREQIEQSEA